jgi:hypothetical protein
MTPMSKHGPEYERQRNEKYFTPAWVTEALLDREAFWGGVWDPAAGAGHITDVVRKTLGGVVIGSDIEPDCESVAFGDFMSETAVYLAPGSIVTNPPFGIGGKLAVDFICRALGLTESQGGKVAMLLPLTFDAAKGRKAIFADCAQFAGKYVLTTRIRWANLEQKKAGPMENHAWYIWDWRRQPGDPFLRYI